MKRSQYKGERSSSWVTNYCWRQSEILSSVQGWCMTWCRIVRPRFWSTKEVRGAQISKFIKQCIFFQTFCYRQSIVVIGKGRK